MAIQRVMSVVPDRKPIFLDTAYVNALVNTRDQWHDAAVQWERKLSTDKRRLVTTEFVLVELLMDLPLSGSVCRRYKSLRPCKRVPWSKSFPRRLSFLLLLWNCTEAVGTKIGA
jgi:hypothetical protein